jgi:uncharacterized membrane protein
LIGYIGVVLGAIFLGGGIFASVYYEVRRGLLFYYEVYPYAQYSGTLLVAGIILLVIGLAFLWRAKQEGSEVPKPPQIAVPNP